MVFHSWGKGKAPDYHSVSLIGQDTSCALDGKEMTCTWQLGGSIWLRPSNEDKLALNYVLTKSCS